VDLVEAVRTFVVVFPAELPDKTMVASVVLVTRFRRPSAVWVGASAAFTIHVAVAVTAGTLLTALPTRLVQFAVAALFALGAVIVLRSSSEEPEHDLEVAAPQVGTWWRAAGVSFTVVLVAEWGDLTQLLTAGLAAASDAPLMVALGAVVALWSVAGLAALLGRALAERVPVTLLRRIAATVFAVLAVVTFAEALWG
jgi:Ca2+/H+ antiporter, TMEM165/GDT1 family